MHYGCLGYKISRITTENYMRELGLKNKLSKKFKINTDFKHNYLIFENIINRQFLFSQPSKVGFQTLHIFTLKKDFYI